MSASVSRSTNAGDPLEEYGYKCARTIFGHDPHQTPQHAQPSAPQNDFRSTIGNRLDHTAAWLWPWTAHALALLRS
jgi:hypothetical protein